MPELDITIDRWLPDYKDTPYAMPKGGLLVCKNLVPLDTKFANIQSPIAYSTNAMTGVPLSGREFYADDSIYYTFIGTDVGLWRIGPGNTLGDVTRTSGAYSTASNKWDFSKFGNWVIATNYNDEVQVIKGMATGNFERLVTNETIKAKYCVVNHGHLLLGYVEKDGLIYPNGVLISKYQTISDFSTVPGAEFVNLQECPGPITGMTVFEFASAGYDSNVVFFHPNSISVAWYTGSPYNFNIDHNRYLEIGALPGSPIMVEGICYFFDEKTIYRWDGINPPEDIGSGVRETVLQQLHIDKYYQITAASHPRYGLAMWAFQSTSALNDNPDKLLIYNVRNKKFALIEQEVYCIFPMHRNQWTIEMLDSFYPTIADIPYAFNNNFWYDNSTTFGCMSTDKKVSVFQGTALDWEIETGEYHTPDKEVIRADRTYPMVQKRAADVTVSIGRRFRTTEDVSYVSGTVQANGYADIIRSGVFLRTKITGKTMDGLTGLRVEGTIIGRH